ncbi:MAG: leucine-rich repeat domain-containing protein [Candidatus Hodarchaeota archaeon]
MCKICLIGIIIELCDDMDFSQSEVERIILNVFEKYRQTRKLFSTTFPESIHLEATLKGLTKEFTDEEIVVASKGLRKDFIHYLQRWIIKEFDNSAGNLALSIEEVQKYFQLDKNLSKKVIGKLLKSKLFILQEDTDLSTGEDIKRLHIHPNYARNYWVKSNIVQEEAGALLELGFKLKEPLNRKVVIKKRYVVELNLSEQGLTSLPSTIGNFAKLDILNLQHNKLKTLPDTIGNLRVLRVLDLDSNRLSSLPESLGNLTKLQFLCCRYNKLKSLPASLGNMENLKKLSLEGNKLRSLPESLGQLTELQKLWCPNNKLKSLPETLGNLSSLKKLSLEHNQLTSLPEPLGTLSKLRILRLFGNKIVSLPKNLMPVCKVCGSILKDPKSKRHISSNKHQEALRKRYPCTQESPENEYLLKICIIGSTKHKSGLVRQFAQGKFETNYLPILGVDITTKKIQINDNHLKLILVDTAGQEFFGKLRPSYYRGASACSIFFDKSDSKSFESVPDLLAEFRKHIPDMSIPLALVGIITNSEHITSEDGQNLARKHKMHYYETKPSLPKQISRIFHDLSRQVLNMRYVSS